MDIGKELQQQRQNYQCEGVTGLILCIATFFHFFYIWLSLSYFIWRETWRKLFVLFTFKSTIFI